MANSVPSRGHSLRDLSISIATQLARGAQPDDLVRQLVGRGWPEVTARQFIANAGHLSGVLLEQANERRAAARPHKQRAIRGLLCTIAGFGIAIIGLNSPDVSAGIYHFAVGVILCIFESIDCLSGLSGWWRHRR